MPARPHPVTTGNHVSIRLSPKPACSAMSAGFMAAALTRTITEFCESFGSGSWPYSSTSDPPKRLYETPFTSRLLKGHWEVVIDTVVRNHPTTIDFLQNPTVVARFDRGDRSLRAGRAFRPSAVRFFRTDDVEDDKLGVERCGVAAHFDDRVVGGVMAPAARRMRLHHRVHGRAYRYRPNQLAKQFRAAGVVIKYLDFAVGEKNGAHRRSVPLVGCPNIPRQHLLNFTFV